MNIILLSVVKIKKDLYSCFFILILILYCLILILNVVVVDRKNKKKMNKDKDEKEGNEGPLMNGEAEPGTSGITVKVRNLSVSVMIFCWQIEGILFLPRRKFYLTI